MSDGLNRVILLGNLGNDPELKQLANGTHVLHLRLATSESYKDKNGEGKEHTEWHDISMFGSRAEPLSRFLQKGMKVMIEGALRTTQYEKDGVKRYRTEIIARDVVIAAKKQQRPSDESLGLSPGLLASADLPMLSSPLNGSGLNGLASNAMSDNVPF